MISNNKKFINIFDVEFNFWIFFVVICFVVNKNIFIKVIILKMLLI